MGGIVPNTLNSELLAPQHGILIAGNYVHDNNNRDAAATSLTALSFGTGIVVAGGRDDLVTGNPVEDHDNAGIVVTPLPDQRLWVTSASA